MAEGKQVAAEYISWPVAATHAYEAIKMSVFNTHHALSHKLAEHDLKLTTDISKWQDIIEAASALLIIDNKENLKSFSDRLQLMREGKLSNNDETIQAVARAIFAVCGSRELLEKWDVEFDDIINGVSERNEDTRQAILKRQNADLALHEELEAAAENGDCRRASQIGSDLLMRVATLSSANDCLQQALQEGHQREGQLKLKIRQAEKQTASVEKKVAKKDGWIAALVLALIVSNLSWVLPDKEEKEPEKNDNKPKPEVFEERSKSQPPSSPRNVGGRQIMSGDFSPNNSYVEAVREKSGVQISI